MNAPLRPSRRAFVVTAASAGGALLVGCKPGEVISLGAPSENFGPFGPFIRIAPDGAVTVVCKHIEMGQGTHAGLAAIVAEELDADWSRVSVVEAPANSKVYANLAFGLQGTGGSSAIANSWDQLRHAGAAARAMLVEAAAQKLGAMAAELNVKDGVISNPATGHTATFAELLPAAATIAPPQAPKLKSRASYHLIGADRVRRKDSPAKVTGAARFTQDVRLPNMLTAMVVHAPRFGGKVKSFDDSAARRIPGVVNVFAIPTGVAVVAEGTWAARQGRDAVKVEWDESRAEIRGSDELAALYRDVAAGKGPADVKWIAFESHGDTAIAPGSGQVLEATYDFPYLAHAAMEPMNCVAEIGGGKTKLTFGSQFPGLDQVNTALIAGVLPGSVEIETLFAGGSFGRRANFKSDYVVECVHIAKHVGGGRPVKLVWTREDDMAAGYYRPLTHHALKVTLGADGLPAVWRHRVVTQSIQKGSPMPGGPVDTTSVEGALGSPYLAGTPVVDAQLAHMEVGVPVLWWRSVGATHTAFAMEHSIDQLARKAARDPIDYRRALYERAGAGAARHRAVLDLAAEKAGWGHPSAGYAQGVAVHESFGSVVAQVAEVKLENGTPRVGRVVTAIDCGIAISPDQIAAQMEGGTCLGLAAALYGAITLKEGRVQQLNFDTYRVLRMNEAPQVETHILPSTNPPSGVGEPGTPLIAPAVANALLALNGQATYSLPFVKSA